MALARARFLRPLRVSSSLTTKQMVMLESDRPHVLREMIYVCRPGGIISVPGVYSGFSDMLPMGAFMNKGLTMRAGQTHVNRWTDDLLLLAPRRSR